MSDSERDTRAGVEGHMHRPDVDTDGHMDEAMGGHMEGHMPDGPAPESGMGGHMRDQRSAEHD